MGKICVACLGWTADDMTLGAVKRLRAAERIILRTARCGAAAWLDAEGIGYASFDALYDQADDFDGLTAQIVGALLRAAESGDVLYGVNDPGDATGAALLAEPEADVEFVNGVGEGGVLAAYSAGSFVQMNAIDSPMFQPDASRTTLAREIDGAILAGELKLRLMEAYPEEWPIIVSLPDGSLRRMPLCELDRMETYDHRVCALIPAVEDIMEKERYAFDDLNRIMRRLRAFDGCPWDREQTHASLRRYLIEEAYEVADAVDSGDTDALYDELGDVLLQVAFHAEIGRECGEFDISDVTTAICRKMIKRHPHVFGGERRGTAEDIVGLWERLKMQEGKLESAGEALERTGRGLPALMRAGKVLNKVRLFGAPTDELEGLLQAAPEHFDSEEAAGDFLLAAALRAARDGMDPELTLSRATDRLVRRFQRLEQAVRAEGRTLDALARDELFLRWKTAEKDQNDPKNESGRTTS